MQTTADRSRPPSWARSDAVAWGRLTKDAKTIPIFTPAGLWFTLDAETCKEIVSVEEETDPRDWIRLLHEIADKDPTISKCYFIGGRDGLVKIGHSIDPEARLKAFMLGCPVDLHILALAPGGEARERAYHTQFADHWVRGEWFERHPDILAEIDRLTAQSVHWRFA